MFSSDGFLLMTDLSQTDGLSSDAVRETRRMLRLVQAHLIQTSVNHGASVQVKGFVDVVHHATSAANELNYVTPRKNTAWVSAKEIEHGIEALRGLGRLARVQYIEGLFPPQFATTMNTLGLHMEHETPLMLLEMHSPPPPAARSLSEGLTISEVTDAQGGALWWYVWRNAFYDVVTQTAPPVAIGMDLYHIASGHQTDFVMMRAGLPIGVARLSYYPAASTAHLESVAFIREARQPRLLRALIQQLMAHAHARGATLIFSSGDAERDAYRELGFIDCGSIVWYAEKANDTHKDIHHGGMAQPLLTVR